MDTQFTKYKIPGTINITGIVSIHYFEFNKGYRSAGEKHDFWEFVYVDKGEAVATADGTEYTLVRGNSSFISLTSTTYSALRARGRPMSS